MGMHSGSLAWWGRGVGSVSEVLNSMDKANLSKNMYQACFMCKGNRLRLNTDHLYINSID